MNDRHDAPAERSRDTERAPLTRRALLGHAWRLGVALPTAGLLACARQPAGPVTPVARYVAHTITPLPDGSLLAVGGIDRGPIAPVQRLVPATGQWFDAGQLREARADHTATLLRDGTVLVVGGGGRSIAGAATGSVERFTPATGRWSTTGALAMPRMRHRAALLDDGTVLVVGGSQGLRVGDRLLAAGERFDPATGKWSPAAPLGILRAGGALLRLADGRLIAIGGEGEGAGSAERYDHNRGSWSATAPPQYTHYSATAALLADGRVLVAGRTDHPEVYDPARDAWAAVAPAPFFVVAVVRVAGTATALIIGNSDVARYDSQTDGWQSAASLATTRSGGAITALPNGTIALVGGGAQRGERQPPASEIYTP